MKAKKKVSRKTKAPAAKRVAATDRTRKVRASRKSPGKSATPKPKAAKRARKPARPQTELSVELPPILLKGDEPAGPLVSGPGEKYTLGPTPPAQTFGEKTVALPASYGTKKLFLTARDPHWLYANWDFTHEQQARFNRHSEDNHLILRVHYAPPAARQAVEIHVHPESHHWFVHVERAATKYSAEIGYYGRKHRWVSVAKSGATLTPAETISDDAGLQFATIPVDVPFKRLLTMVEEASTQHQPLARAIEELRIQGHPELPPVTVMPGAADPLQVIPAWTPERERALAQMVTLDDVRRVWVGSLEITELIRRQLNQDVPGAAPGESSQPAPAAGLGVSSPGGGEQPQPQGFWFSVNAELIVYGATERNAAVTIGGRPIQLRPDGSFSYRFALPDGNYHLPVVAVSPDGTDGRAAELRFTRVTEMRGEVGSHPSDPALQPPTPESF